MRTVLCIALAYVAFSSLCLKAYDELSLRAVTPAEETLLVMTNGRVVSGQMTHRNGGYDVVLPAGRMFVADKQIRFQVNNMEEAYLRMRETLPHLTPDTHLELARWCLANNLPSNARREALDALHLDPHRTDAQRMLESLVREQQRSRQRSTPQITTESLKQAQLERSMAPERRSLGGLPTDRAQEFTQRVQPLLTNKCGNTKCHGADRNEFAVVTLRRNASAATTEQNLAAVLNQINFQNPEHSPILHATQGLHGGNIQPLFPGQTGGRQVTAFREWVVAVAGELAPTERSVGQQQIQQTAFSTPLEPTVETNSHNGDVLNKNVLDEAGETEMATRLDRKFVSEAASAARHDDFDPDVFNLRYHGKTRSEMTVKLQQGGPE